MIRCTLQIYTRGKWHKAPKLGTFKRVESARKMMKQVQKKLQVPVRIVSEFNTIVDGSDVEFDFD